MAEKGQTEPMKPDIHPAYRPVVFLDQSAGESFITNSTIETSETVEWEDGNTYPLAKVEISAMSHPFFTGTMKIVDTAGRVERFERRYGARKKAAPKAEEAAPVDTAPAVDPVEEQKAKDKAKDRAEAKAEAAAIAKAEAEAEAPAAPEASAPEAPAASETADSTEEE